MTISSEQSAVLALYRTLIAGWDERDAAKLAGTMSDEADMVGFDGSRMKGRAHIEATLSLIFSRHQTPPFVTIIREVRFPSPDVAVLTAIVGMVPTGWTELDPNLHSVQTMVAVRHNGTWRIEVFQNTPAALHGRPQLKDQITAELKQAMKKKS